MRSAAEVQPQLHKRSTTAEAVGNLRATHCGKLGLAVCQWTRRVLERIEYSLRGLHRAITAMPSELCTAVRQGDAHRVLNLLENGVNANEVDDNGDNALHWAVFCGHVDLCELLLQRGADWRKKTGRAGYTVLHDAAWDGSTEMLARLLAYGADPDISSSSGSTAAHEAAYRGELEFLKLLSASGANMRAVCLEGMTPLEYARKAGQDATVQWLEETLSNPSSLQEVCLKTVRQAVPKGLLFPVHTPEEQLPLPNHVLSALRFHFEAHSNTGSGDDSGCESDHEVTLL